MLNLKEEIDKAVAEAFAECAAAYAKGAIPMMRLLTKRTQKASVPTRVHYVLGAIQAMGVVDPLTLTNFFEALWSRTPKTEEGLHTEAMEIVFQQLLQVVTQQMTQKLQTMAHAMRIEDEFEVFSTIQVDPNGLTNTDEASDSEQIDPKSLH